MYLVFCWPRLINNCRFNNGKFALLVRVLMPNTECPCNQKRDHRVLWVVTRNQIADSFDPSALSIWAPYRGWNINQKKALIWVNPGPSSLSFYSSGFDLAKVKKQVTWSRSTESCTELTAQSISFRTGPPLTEMGILFDKDFEIYL